MISPDSNCPTTADRSAESERFLRALGWAPFEPDEWLVVCGFAGDPAAAPKNAWRPRPWRPDSRHKPPFAAPWNGYCTVATFASSADGSVRRRAEAFVAGRALMVDDVGTKVDAEQLKHMPPTLRVETSPGNEQWWYVLERPERDRGRFDALIRAFIAERLLGADPGMAGVNRVGRLPGWTNAKPRPSGPWRVRTTSADGPRWTVEALVRGFGLRLVEGRAERAERRLVPPDTAERLAQWAEVTEALRNAGALKVEAPDRAGWWEMTCPWLDEHTARADNGAALREPADDNDWRGAFRCFHGHCAGRGWRALTEHVAAVATEALERANDNAPTTWAQPSTSTTHRAE